MARRNRPRKQRRRTPLDDQARDRSGVVDMTNELPESRSGEVRSIEPGSPADVAEREDRGGPDVVSLIPDPPQREFVFDEPDAPEHRETLAETEDLDLPDPGSDDLDDALDEDPDPWAAEAGSFDDEADDEGLDEPDPRDDPEATLSPDDALDDLDADDAEEEEAPAPPRRSGRLQRPIDAEFGTGLGSDEVRDGETIGYLDSALGDADADERDAPHPSDPAPAAPVEPPAAAGPEREDEPPRAPAARSHLRLVRPGEAPPPPAEDLAPVAEEARPPSLEPPVPSDADELGPEVLVAASAAPPADALELDDELAEARREPEPAPEPEPSYPSEARLRRQRLAAQDDALPPLPEPGSVPRMAPLRARVAAMVVDGGLLLLFVPLTVLLGVLAFGLDGYRAVPAAEARGIAFSAVNGLLTLSVAVYFGLSQGCSGSTPGKHLMRIKVVRAEDGEPIGLGRSLLRVAAYGLNLLTLGGGFLYALYDPRRRGLHDILTQTFVAKDD